MTKSVVGLGKLEQLEVVDHNGQHPRTLRPKQWLVWSPTKRQYYLATVSRNPTASELRRFIGTGQRTRAMQSASATAVAKAHHRFHRAPAQGYLRVNVADHPQGRTVSLGRLKSLIYKVPDQVRSPGKNRIHWHHAFGDTGHKGGTHYPVRVMPEVVRDARGNLFIKRRPGNIFTVDTWLRG